MRNWIDQGGMMSPLVLLLFLGSSTKAAHSPEAVERLVLAAANRYLETTDAKLPTGLGGYKKAKALCRTVPQAKSTERLWKRFIRLPGAQEEDRFRFEQLELQQQQLTTELAEATARILTEHPGHRGKELIRLLQADGLILTQLYGRIVVDGLIWLTTDERLSAFNSTPLSESEAQLLQERLKVPEGQLRIDKETVVAIWKLFVEEHGAGAVMHWKNEVELKQVHWLQGNRLRALLLGVDDRSFFAHFRHRLETRPWQTGFWLGLSGALILLAIPPFRRRLASLVSRRNESESRSGSSIFGKHEPFRE